VTLVFVQMLAILLSPGLCQKRFLESIQGSVGNSDFGAEGSAEFDPNAEVQEQTWSGGAKP